MTHTRLFPWLLGLTALGACGSPSGRGDPYHLATPLLEVTVDGAGGTFDVVSLGGDGTALRGLHLAVELVEGSATRRVTTRGRSLICVPRGAAGGGEVRDCAATVGDGLVVGVRLGVDPAHPGLLACESYFSHDAAAPLTVRKLQPLRLAAAEGGAVWLGDDPSRVRILQNGRDEIVDFYVDLLPGDLPLSDPEQIPLIAEYSSYSNGHVLAHDLDSGASLLVGFLDHAWATPLVALAGGPEAAPVGGRTPLTDLLAEARYPAPVRWPAGHEVAGGTAVLLLGAPTPFDALEAYADAIARHHEVDLPPRPYSGWDSWYTDFAFTELTDEFVRASADGLAAELGPYGLDSMQLDLGWQDTWGDWNARPELSEGMDGLAEYIKVQGLKPELWFAPLSADEDSQVYQDHAGEWFVGKNMYGQVLMEQSMHPLDLTRDDVLEHIEGLGARVRDWGYESVKLDFAYYILYSEFPPHVDDTPSALYRRAVRRFRDGLGPDPYFININATVLNYGLVDGFRIGLDDWPCWEGGDDCSDYVNAPGISAQGIKPGVRMAARRYWLNGRVWWNHLDQLFFRDQTHQEAAAFASLVGLSGGMISLGEDVRNLTVEQLDVYRRLLPLSGETARPLDLFQLEFPEVWHLTTGEGEDRADIVGLFHWGRNRDLTTWPPVERPDGEPLTHVVDLEALGLDPGEEYVAVEFWSGEVRGSVREALTATLAPHTARVFKLVPRPTTPAVLSTNRHLLMGPGVVRDVQWREGASALTGTVSTVRGDAQSLTVWVPEGLHVAQGEVEGAGGMHWEPTDELFPPSRVLEFTGADTGPHEFTIVFGRLP